MEAFHASHDVGAAAAVVGRIAGGPADPGATVAPAPRQKLCSGGGATTGAAGAGVSTGTGTAEADEDGRTEGCHAGHFWFFFKLMFFNDLG